MKKNCFAIMPFRSGFDEIDRIVERAASRCGLKYIRGDRRNKPGLVLPQIVHDIRQASVIVADLTNYNPNVLYELGIAHQLKGPDRIVLITQSVDTNGAYDLQQFRQFVYKHDTEGRARLLKELPSRMLSALQASQHEEFWSVIRGRLPRTQMLARELNRIAEHAGPRGLKGTTIRIAAGLSSLAISNHEPPDSKLGDEYLKALLAERDALRRVLLRGAKLKAVLNPPRRFGQAQLPERLQVRYRRLIGLLEGRSDIRRKPKAAADDLRALKQCEFAFSPVAMPNLFIVGKHVAYEGMKRAAIAGFERTHCETDPEGVRELIENFDHYFEDSRRELLRSHPSDVHLARLLRQCYKDATGEDLS